MLAAFLRMGGNLENGQANYDRRFSQTRLSNTHRQGNIAFIGSKTLRWKYYMQKTFRRGLDCGLVGSCLTSIYQPLGFTNQVWRHMAAVPVLGRWRPEHHAFTAIHPQLHSEFWASLGFKSKTKQIEPPRIPGKVGSWEDPGTWC